MTDYTLSGATDPVACNGVYSFQDIITYVHSSGNYAILNADGTWIVANVPPMNAYFAKSGGSDPSGSYSNMEGSGTVVVSAPATGTNFQINVGDAWKDVTTISVNVGDAWKSVTSALVNVGDAWKTIF